MAVSSLSKILVASQISDLIETPGILLVDIRPRNLYRRGHVPDGDLVLIGQDQQHTAAVMEELYEQGYTRQISYVDGGFPSWQQYTAASPHASNNDWLRVAQQMIGGAALFLVGGVTQSLALLGLGVVLLLGPWATSRSRA